MNYKNEIGLMGNINVLFERLNNINSLFLDSVETIIKTEQEITENYLDNIEVQQQITEIQLKILEEEK